MWWGLNLRWLDGLALLGALALSFEAEAQVALGDLHATGSGELTVLYDANFGNLTSDQHSLGFGGLGTITGNYYDPNFLSFNLLPYYGRSQNNSDTQSITDASGYNGNVNLFGGSHFPGFFNFNQTWNSSGTFGIPGLAGLTTDNNSHGLNLGWSVLVPHRPTLSIGYGDTSGTSSLLGSEASTQSSMRNFNLGSTDNLAGFYLAGSFIHLNTNAEINGLEDGESETTNGSSNQYRFTAQRGLPYNNSHLSLGFYRTSYSVDDSLAGRNDGTTDNVNGIVSLMTPKAPVTLSATYTDNLFGSFEQQLISSGETPLVGIVSPTSHSLSLEASTFYNVLPRLVVGGYVERTQEFFAGQNYGLTQVGLNVNYNFFRKLKGLVVSAGVVDSANQQGNTRLGFVGNASYNRYFGKWEVSSYILYNQDVQTLLVNYTTSILNYGASLKHQFSENWRWIGLANVARSVFEQQSGTGNHGESFATMLIWRRASVSGNYTKSSGTSILTATGLVPTPVPAAVISPSNAIVYSGDSYGGSLNVFPVRNMTISTAYSRSLSNTVSPLLLSNNAFTNYYGLATYQYRKLLFTAGVTKFNQRIGFSNSPPAVLTSYAFGVSRWFKGF